MVISTASRALVRSICIGFFGLAGACGSSSSGDKCKQFTAKAGPAFDKIIAASGKTMDSRKRAEMMAEGEQQCRKKLQAGKTDPVMDCVLAASDDAAVNDCLQGGVRDYAAKGNAGAAMIDRNRAIKDLTSKYVDDGLELEAAKARATAEVDGAANAGQPALP